jgi:hypothetical protein
MGAHITISSFPRRRESIFKWHKRNNCLKYYQVSIFLDSRFHGNDKMGGLCHCEQSEAIQKNIKYLIMSIIHKLMYPVIPAQAGIQAIVIASGAKQ